MENKKRVLVITQCRLSSTRLPGKALLPLNGKSLLEWHLCAMKKVKADDYILATDFDSAPKLSPLAAKCGFKLFQGPRDDVLLRYTNAIKEFDGDIILRSTADNPFIFFEACNDLLEEYFRLSQSQKIDYMTLTSLPHGSGIELFTKEAIFKAIENTSDPYDHEHVGPAIYNHKDLFNSLFIPAAKSYAFPNFRTTVDTYQDYRRALRIVSVLKEKGVSDGPFSFEEILLALNDERVKNPLLFLPSTQKGLGTGHLRRCIELAVETKGDIFIAEDASLEECQPLLDEAFSNGLEKWQVVDEILNASQYSLAVTDLFYTDQESAKNLSRECPLLALDEGNENLDAVDYYLDVIPSANEERKINFSSPDFLRLPSKCHKEKVRWQNIKNALVTFGGEDPAQLTLLTARELLKVNLNLTVILPKNADENSIEELKAIAKKNNSNLILLSSVKNLREELYKYDLILTHYGFTAFEARKAKCAVILAATSPYHLLLSKKYGFPCLVKSQILAENFEEFFKGGFSNESPIESPLKEIHMAENSVLNADDSLSSSFDFESSKSLSSFILKIAGGKKLNCPVCHSPSFENPVLYRIKDRTFRTCKKCGMEYIGWTIKAIQTEYNHDYFFDDYQKQYGKTYLEDFDSIKKQGFRRLDNIISIIRKNKSEKKCLLDIGCALGPFLSAAKEKGFIPYGTDIADDAVDYVKNKLNFSCVKSSFPDAGPLKEFDVKVFDAVTMWYVIEHFENLKDVLTGVNRILKRGGTFSFSTPSGSGVSAKYNTKSFFENSPSDHFTLWQPEKAKGILRRFGFKVIKIIPTGIHPERFPDFKEKNIEENDQAFNKLARECVKKMLGDTFEVYCRKIKNI